VLLALGKDWVQKTIPVKYLALKGMEEDLLQGCGAGFWLVNKCSFYRIYFLFKFCSFWSLSM
jgi:hypothetical protein